MSNSAYKHLDTKLKIADMTIMQWVGVILGVTIGLAWGLYLSPLGDYLTLFTAIYLGGVPVMLAFLSSQTDFDLWLRVRSFVAWRRGEDRFVPGGIGEEAPGYTIMPPPGDPRAGAGKAASELDVAALWD